MHCSRDDEGRVEEGIFEPVFTLINKIFHKVMENTNATETVLHIKKENNQQRAAENEVTKYTFYYSVYILYVQDTV